MMKFCPNLNLPESKALINKLGLFGFYKVYIENDYNIPSLESIKDIPNIVDGLPKVVEVFNKNFDKLKQWFNNKAVAKDVFWKKFQELGVPKDQIELLKNTEGESLDETILNFIANYNYTVEINTAKINEGNIALTRARDDVYEDRPDLELGSEEFEKAVQERLKQTNSNTSYYSNLTVPGGTNYTENEIAIPGVEVEKGPQGSTIKEGVSELFKDNSELANIGTQEQYSQYLNTIFPDSQVKDIVYHGSYAKQIDKFSKDILGRTSLTGFLPKGFYFTNQPYVAATYTAPKDVYNRAVWNSLLNVIEGVKDETGDYIQEPTSFEKILSYIGKSDKNKEFIIDYRDGKLEDSFGGAAELGLFLPSKEDTELYLKLLRNKDLKGIKNERDKYLDEEGNIFSVLLDIKTPLNKTSATGSVTTINLEGKTTGEKRETLNKELKNSDGLIVNDIRDSSDYKPKINIKYNENINEQTYVVFEPEQIHILSSKQDIEGFKKWKKDNTKTVRKGAITPAIKGHAQFATENGIGWFRSDDKDTRRSVIKDGDLYFEEIEDIGMSEISKEDYENVVIDKTKTRRILEVQSDWGQKQRKSSEPDINIKYDIQQIINDLQKSGDLKIDCN